MNVGDRARFFDAISGWRETGDIGDNDKYYLPATVERSYRVDGHELVDIRFDHRPDHVSKAHFAEGNREIYSERSTG